MMNDSYDVEFVSALFDKRSYEELRQYVLRFALAGDSNAQCTMGFLVEHGLGGPSDLDAARDWLCKSAEQNNPLAWNNLGTFWVGRGDREKARQCYRRAAELGFTMAAGLAE